MYVNLEKMMEKKGIKEDEIFAFLGYKSECSNEAIKRCFTFDEVIKIRNFFFPEYTIEYLFE
ncbi:hypothetical protein [Enterococcus wangshanyuanii]|uniref:Transcriptional regulator n=1 Tax=Enterococcus wangshanyuanii TaxID=2005703 RepID=A0ABQ1PD83_9ENTE|nr:hypothetical protein [Enterococcus wangshanyuanii]GGC94975.1 hypothetical protein GCM10011573_25800 [Enterococcus wangshanyuanii]